MTPPNNQSQEVLRECPFCGGKAILREHEGFQVMCSVCDVRGHDWTTRPPNQNKEMAMLKWNTRTTPQESPKHCSTCKHFKRIYPENYQLGVCEYLEVTNLQPCGHMIDRSPIASDKFVPAKGYNICINRMMDSFGCVYHCPKEEGETK